jgi:hypothetical protein
VHRLQLQRPRRAAHPPAFARRPQVQGQLDGALRFVVDQKIEAPGRMAALQSYRVAVAVLRQQQQFVQGLFDTGIIHEVGLAGWLAG